LYVSITDYEKGLWVATKTEKSDWLIFFSGYYHGL
jgi:hypothetical protein